MAERAHTRSEFFCSAPRPIVPGQNTKTGVMKAYRYDPDLNLAYRRALSSRLGGLSARPYKLPTRPRKLSVFGSGGSFCMLRCTSHKQQSDTLDIIVGFANAVVRVPHGCVLKLTYSVPFWPLSPGRVCPRKSVSRCPASQE